MKISGFRVVTIHAVSVQDYINDASHSAPEGRDSLKSFISPTILVSVTICQKLCEIDIMNLIL